MEFLIAIIVSFIGILSHNMYRVRIGMRGVEEKYGLRARIPGGGAVLPLQREQRALLFPSAQCGWQLQVKGKMILLITDLMADMKQSRGSHEVNSRDTDLGVNTPLKSERSG